MDIIIKKQELENISSLLPTIIYNELLKFTEEPISIEGDVTSPTTESVVETKIDKSVLLIKIKLFKKALEKDKSNKVLKIKIKLFEKELTKYANGGGVGGEYTYEIKSEVSIQNQGKKFEKRMNVWGGNVFVNGKSKVFIPFGYDTKEEAEARAKKIIEELKKGKFKGYNLITERLLDKYSRGYAKGGGVGSYKNHKVGDFVEKWGFMGKSKIMKIIGFEDGRKTYILESEDGKSRSYTPKKYIANLSGEFPLMANGGGVGDVYKLIDGENTWYLTYLDSTHFFLSNTKEYKGSPYHIGEFRSRPFYNEVLSWLNSNKGKMAKGGGVDYNENREMVLNDNKQIAHHTKELQSAVKGKNVPAWVVAKVNRSASDLSDSTHYMEGQGESYADGGSIKIGDKVMLPEIKMRDGKIQFEKVENGEVIEIQDGIYSVLNPKTNRIHQVSLNQIKFNNGGGVAIVGGEKVTEQQKDAIIKIINTYNESWYSVSKYSDGSVAISLVVKNNDPKHKEKYVEYIGAIGKDGNYKFRDMEKYLDDISEYRPKFTYAKGGSMASGGVFNGKYLDTISSDKKNKILKNIANNYGFSIAEALAEVVDADAEMLYEYISNDQLLRMSVYNDIEGGKFAKGTTVKGGVEEWSIVTKNEEEHFDNYADARGFWNGLSKLEKANGQFFRKVWVNGEEGEVEILGGKLYAKGNTVKSGVKKWINPDRISKLEYEIATIKKNAILKKDIQSDADRKRIKEKILKPMEEQLELLKKGIDTPSPFKYD